MKKSFRLQKNWEFQKIIDLKQQIISKYLILYLNKNNDFKIGLSIPKKFANAVQRNYLRRQIKSILQTLNITQMKFHLVLIVRKPFIDLAFTQKREQIEKIFKRLGEYEK